MKSKRQIRLVDPLKKKNDALPLRSERQVSVHPLIHLNPPQYVLRVSYSESLTRALGLDGISIDASTSSFPISSLMELLQSESALKQLRVEFHFDLTPNIAPSVKTLLMQHSRKNKQTQQPSPVHKPSSSTMMVPSELSISRLGTIPTTVGRRASFHTEDKISHHHHQLPPQRKFSMVSSTLTTTTATVSKPSRKSRDLTILKVSPSSSSSQMEPHESSIPLVDSSHPPSERSIHEVRLLLDQLSTSNSTSTMGDEMVGASHKTQIMPLEWCCSVCGQEKEPSPLKFRGCTCREVPSCGMCQGKCFMNDVEYGRDPVCFQCRHKLCYEDVKILLDHHMISQQHYHLYFSRILEEVREEERRRPPKQFCTCCGAELDVKSADYLHRVECEKCKEVISLLPEVPWKEERNGVDTTPSSYLEDTLGRCPHCSRLIERPMGCEHVLCKCGFEFCYICLNDYYEIRKYGRDHHKPSCMYYQKEE